MMTAVNPKWTGEMRAARTSQGATECRDVKILHRLQNLN